MKGHIHTERGVKGGAQEVQESGVGARNVRFQKGKCLYFGDQAAWPTLSNGCPKREIYSISTWFPTMALTKQHSG